MKRSRVFMVRVCIFCAFSLQALTPEEIPLKPKEERDMVLRKGEKLLEVAPQRQPRYLSAIVSPQEQVIIEAEIKRVAPNILIEGVFSIPQSSPITMLYFYNSLLTIKAFAHATYYNEEHQLTHPLFGSSYAIFDHHSRQEMADPIVHSLEPSKEVLAYQDFLPMSPVVSLYTYAYEKGLLSFKAVNLDPVKYKIFTAIGSQKLIMRIVVKERQDSFLVYMLAYTRVASLFGKGERLFTYRIKGLFHWYFETYLSPLVS